MASDGIKAELQSYLRGAREALVWKLDGLEEYDIRRPLTPSGTNLLGLVKHSTASHLRYFGEVFGRPMTAVEFPGAAEGPGAEFWATPGESSERIVARYEEVCKLADTTIRELPLDAPGEVRWWGGASVTLHHILVHVIAETQRHAGHADILREMVDGSIGLLPGSDNLRVHDAEQRRLYEQIEAAAAVFR